MCIESFLVTFNHVKRFNALKFWPGWYFFFFFLLIFDILHWDWRIDTQVRLDLIIDLAGDYAVAGNGRAERLAFLDIFILD